MPAEEISTTNRTKKLKTSIGLSLIVMALVMTVSFVSFFNNWKQDQSQLQEMFNKNQLANNIFGKFGAWLGDVFVFQSFGFAAFIVPIFLLLIGVKFIIRLPKIKRAKILLHSLFFLIWLPVFAGYIMPNYLVAQGVIGYESNTYLQALIGNLGIGVLLLVVFVLYLIVEWRLNFDFLQRKINQEIGEELPEVSHSNKHNRSTIQANQEKNASVEERGSGKTPAVIEETISNSVDLDSNTVSDKSKKSKPSKEKDETKFEVNEPSQEEDIALTVEETQEEPEILQKQAVEEFGEFDPTLELSNYQHPTIDLLKNYESEGKITIDQKELEANKNRIVETLGNYKIGIDKIKATIGPTVTLYEIVPEAGVRISKIKNLEDDIALSLSALGIRIIAPIPGKGTIGIEVPNSHTSIVSMRSVIASPKFQDKKDMALPMAFGKTIANETFVADLAKMPHLLMAGATGQGKSVGLNAIITSLLYKKHPAELKFVFVDPKKVELTLYNKIERHFLAKLPDSEEAIITDNNKVINTLNSLCIEMDERYELLKNAYVRNIQEYNKKFKQRKLNPENGHRFLPYIVLVVDEFADLIMTAGKEVEMPIARLAQLARAVGIHLIIATQRPSVNVITGIIKANFPARVAFRVTSKIDSRTILDSGGADQLIGKGDMLFTKGNDLIRLQCAFVDTPEVEKITEFIGAQRAYPSAHLLPEYVGEEAKSALDVDLDERDALFEEAAKLMVSTQQGSTSLIQRKLKLGYNRAGRIIDQLEAAGIVGPFEGSKARQVLVPDDYSLEQLLNNLNQPK